MFKRKLGAILLALSCALPLPVYATGQGAMPLEQVKTGVMTIHSYDMSAARKEGVDLRGLEIIGRKNKSAEGVLAPFANESLPFVYMRIGDATLTYKNGKALFAYTLPKELEDILGMKEEDVFCTKNDVRYYTFANIQEKIASASTGVNDYFYAAPREDFGMTDSNGCCKKSAVRIGLYMAGTKEPGDVPPFLVSIPITDATGAYPFFDVDCYPMEKEDDPDMERILIKKGKQGKTMTIGGQDIVKNCLVTRIPESLDIKPVTEMFFIDNIPSGLQYQGDPEVRFYDRSADAKEDRKEKAIANWETDGTYLEKKAGDKDTLLTLFFTEKGLQELTEKYAGKYMVVSNRVSLAGNTDIKPGDDGNLCDSSLVWKKSGDESRQVVMDENILYTYGLSLQLKGESDDFSKCSYQIINKDGYLSFKKEGTVYYVDGICRNPGKSTSISPLKNGELLILGMDSGNYQLEETQTAPGTKETKNPIAIKIRPTESRVTKTLIDVTADRGKNNKTENTARTRNTIALSIDKKASAVVRGEDKKLSSFSDGNEEMPNAIVKIKIEKEKKTAISAGHVIPGLLSAILIGGVIFWVGKIYPVKKAEADTEEKKKKEKKDE